VAACPRFEFRDCFWLYAQPSAIMTTHDDKEKILKLEISCGREISNFQMQAADSKTIRHIPECKAGGGGTTQSTGSGISIKAFGA
jgi:hypothetical protein